MKDPRTLALLVIAVVALGSLYWGLRATKLSFGEDLLSYIPGRDRSVEALRDVEKRFAIGKAGFIFLEFNDSVFSEGNLRKIKRIVDRISVLPGVGGIVSAFTVPFVYERGGSLAIDTTFGMLDRGEATSEIRRRIIGDPNLRGFISKDEKCVELTVEVVGDDKEVVWNIKKVLEEEGWGKSFRAYFSGGPFIVDYLRRTLPKELLKLTTIASVVMSVVLLLGFGSLRGVLIPLSIPLLSALWVLGIFQATGRQVTIPISTLPVILVAIGVPYGIHVFARISERTAVGDTIADGLDEVKGPVIGSAVTTAVGFASLIAAKVSPLRSFGAFGAMGVIFLLVFSLTLVPALFTVFSGGGTSKPLAGLQRPIKSALRKFEIWASKRRRLVAGVALLIILVCMLGISRISVEVDPARNISPNSELGKSFDFARSRFGGGSVGLIYMEGDMKNPWFLHRLLILERAIMREVKGVKMAWSIADVVEGAFRALKGRSGIPQTESQVAEILALVEGGGFLRNFLDPTYSKGIVRIEFVAKDEKDIRRILRQIKGIVPDRLFLRGISFSEVLGNPVIRSKFLGRLREDLKEVASIYLSDKDMEDLWGRVSALRKDRDFWVRVSERIVSSGVFKGVISDRLLTDLVLTYSKGGKKRLRRAMVLLGLGDSDLVDILSNEIEGAVMELESRRRVETALRWLKSKGYTITPEVEMVTDVLGWEKVYLIDRTGKPFDFVVTGLEFVIPRASESLIRSQESTGMLALVLVFAILLGAFRSFKEAFFGIFPIVATVLTCFGIMGFAGIPISGITASIAAIAIGAGIDYVIHFFFSYNRTGSVALAAQDVGDAIVLNTVAVSTGFLVLVLSEFKGVQEFGVMTALALVASTIYTFMFAPLFFPEEKIER